MQEARPVLLVPWKLVRDSESFGGHEGAGSEEGFVSFSCVDGMNDVSVNGIQS